MRDEVLIEHAQSYEFGPDGCEVVDGVWIGPYTGERLTDPSDVHIDHVVPLKEAHTSGAAEWSYPDKRRFANEEANRRQANQDLKSRSAVSYVLTDVDDPERIRGITLCRPPRRTSVISLKPDHSSGGLI